MDYLKSMFGLDGRVAIVTGGASGLGAAFSKGLAAAGATVVIADIDEELAGEVVRRSSGGGAAGFRRVDVTNCRRSRRSQTRSSRARPGRRADQQRRRRAPLSDREFSEEAYDRILALNLKGTYFMSQAVGRKMLAQGKGSIVNIASIGGFIAYPHASAYLASKGGVVQTTRSFALEWHGKVRVNAIAPGLVDSPLLQKALAASGSTTTTDFIQQRMLGPLLTPTTWSPPRSSSPATVLRR